MLLVGPYKMEVESVLVRSFKSEKFTSNDLSRSTWIMTYEMSDADKDGFRKLETYMMNRKMNEHGHMIFHSGGVRQHEEKENESCSLCSLHFAFSHNESLSCRIRKKEKLYRAPESPT